MRAMHKAEDRLAARVVLHDEVGHALVERLRREPLAQRRERVGHGVHVQAMHLREELDAQPIQTSVSAEASRANLDFFSTHRPELRLAHGRVLQHDDELDGRVGHVAVDAVVLDGAQEAQVHFVPGGRDARSAQLLLDHVQRHVRDVVEAQVLALLAECADVQRAVLHRKRDAQAR
jgi:hypothetical protein